MEAKILKQNGAKVVLHVKGVSRQAANALRRAILSDLECFAIDEVDFTQNTSALFNEYVANRLGLIPLTWEESTAADARVQLSLNAEGPCMVYSRDLKSSDDAIMPFNENVPIMKLAAGQKLSIEATAVRGTAKKHAKFQCAMASYSAWPEIRKKSGASWESVLKDVPKELVSRDGKIADYAKADLIEHFLERNEDAQVEYKDDEYAFVIESYNNVPPMQQLSRALNVLEGGFDRALKKS